MSVTNSAACVAILGKSGAGKSTIIKRLLKSDKPKRLVVWSPDEDLDNYKQFGGKVVRSIDQLCVELKKKNFNVVFWPSLDDKKRSKEFLYFCKAVYSARNCVLIVEELASCTSASYAPPDWTVITTRGRKAGIKVYGTSQRPAKIDKDFLGNSTLIYCSALKYRKDRTNVAESMDIDEDLLKGLEPTESPVILRWVKRGDNVPFERFDITFPKKAA